MRNLEGSWYDAIHVRRRRWGAVMALGAIGLMACSGDSSGPSVAAPGSILVKTQTSGFNKAAGYDVVVQGVSTKAIGANDEVTVSGVEPGSYSVNLSNVPENCTTQGATASVESEKTVQVLFNVTCSFAEPATYTVQVSRDRPDLDTGALTVCTFGICPSQQLWDLYVASNNADSGPRSVIRQNSNAAVEIAHLPGVTLATLKESDVAGATFTTAVVGDAFDAGRVILVRTDMGNVYVLGNPVEDPGATLKLTFQAALIATP